MKRTLILSALTLIFVAGLNGNAQQKSADKPASVTSAFTQPLAIAWFYPAETTHFDPIVENDRVFLPIADGSIVCLSATTGDLLWKSGPSADLTATPIGISGELFVAAKKGTNPGDSTAGILRVLDKQTGVALRSFDLARPLTTLTSNGDVLYAGSEDGKVYAMHANNGSIVWAFQTGGPVHGHPLFLDGKIYVGSDDNAFYAIDAATGKMLWMTQTHGRITGRSSSDGKRIYFGSGDGFVYALSTVNGTLAWKLRTGATVDAAPVQIGKNLIVGSYDNFLYALNPRGGNIVWKHRLDSRITSSPLVDDSNALVAPIRSRTLSSVDAVNGVIVAETSLPEDSGEVVSAALRLGPNIYFSTDLGMVALKTR